MGFHEQSEAKQKSVLVEEISTDRGNLSSVKDQLNLPEHLQPVYPSSKEHLSADECTQLAELLGNYQDVFARDEFE